MNGLPSLDELRRMQDTLQRRVVSRDPTNILSVGFIPAVEKRDHDLGQKPSPVAVQFLVKRKRKHVAEKCKI